MKIVARMACAEQTSKARELIERLARKIDEMSRDLTGKTWANHGDLCRLVDALQGVSDQVFQEGEYRRDR